MSSSGNLLGMTYVPEQEVAAWHQHDSAASGVFESCAIVTETTRTCCTWSCAARSTARASATSSGCTRAFATLADAFYVDCGLTYSGAPATTISGLTHLEGQAVNVLADGAGASGQTVSGGAITLAVAASKVQVGLPITAQVKTPPPPRRWTAPGAGPQMNVNKAILRVYRSAGFKVGPRLHDHERASTRRLHRGRACHRMQRGDALTSWNWDGSICVQRTTRCRWTLASLTLEVAIGG
jgi:hypothetical protein